MEGQANAIRACNSLAYPGKSMCRHAPLGALCSPARTVYQDVSPRSGWWLVCSVLWRDVGLREIGHRIVARLEEQEDVLAIGDPVSAKTHAHPPTQRLNVQQSVG